ncbi:hypothetical protein Javan630_0047 [Streptococcus phage Javan630]|nr:hypothetical protein Javan630_0047 [Streptococcus phage Javan630]
MISAGHVSLATRSGAMTNTLQTRKLSKHKSNMADKVITLLPKPISRNTAEMGWDKINSVA